MRFMIIVRGNQDSEAGVLPAEPLVAAMAAYHEQLAKAGVLLDANGLQPSAKGFRLRWQGGRRTLVDGPFAESKELVAGRASNGRSASPRRSARMRTARSRSGRSTSSTSSAPRDRSTASATCRSRHASSSEPHISTHTDKEHDNEIHGDRQGVA
jgi:hypothetical protein